MHACMPSQSTSNIGQAWTPDGYIVCRCARELVQPAIETSLKLICIADKRSSIMRLLRCCFDICRAGTD